MSTYSKPTKDDIIRRITRLRQIMEDLESDPHNRGYGREIAAWKKWMTLTRAEQTKIMSDWEQYYKDVRNTPTFLIFQEIKLAMQKKDLERVRSLSADARLINLQKAYVLKKPTSIDPWEFNYSLAVKAYMDAQRIIRELTDYPDILANRKSKEVFEQHE